MASAVTAVTTRLVVAPPTEGRASPPEPPRRRVPYDLEGLLAVAVAVFTERGYDGTSMDDVARATGLSKSSLYHHVAGKEALLRAALERALVPLFAVLDEPAARRGRAVQRLEHVLRREVHVLVGHLPYVSLLLRVHGNTATERDALARRREFDRRVAALVGEAIEDGDVRADLDPALVTRLVFGTVNSLVEWYAPDRGPASADEVADAVLALVTSGIRTRPEEHA